MLTFLSVVASHHASGSCGDWRLFVASLVIFNVMLFVAGIVKMFVHKMLQKKMNDDLAELISVIAATTAGAVVVFVAITILK